MKQSRRAFVASTFAGGVALAGGARANAQLPQAARGRALILTGGVNRGAYQAGVVAGLAEAAGLGEGQPLDYDLIAGSSIGALNAYFVATAQYAHLRGVWRAVAAVPLFELKERFRKIGVTSSGVGTRLHAAISLALGMVSNVKGVVDPAPLLGLLDGFVDVTSPIHIPSYFSATNLTRKRTEVFVARGTSAVGAARQARIDGVLAKRRGPVLHPVAGRDVRAALFASAALPIIFDPVLVPRVEDPATSDEFIDGGMADNVPIGIARRCATDIDIVGVDPPVDLEEDADYPNAAAIGTAVFGVMQTRIIQQTVKLAYAESLLAAGIPATADELRDEELPIRIRAIRPQQELPGKLGDFSDLAALDAMHEIGRADALRGWLPFDPRTAFGAT